VKNLVAFGAIVARDTAELLRQYGVVIGNLVVPFVFLLVAAAGFSDAFGRALGEPYDTYVIFAEYLTPGLACLVLFLAVSRSTLALFGGQGAADMRLLTVSPVPVWTAMLSKLVAVAGLATVQAALLIAVSPLAGADIDVASVLLALPAAFVAAMMLAAVTLALIVLVPKLLSFSTMALFVVLPGFLLSSALYPLWKFTDYGADYLNTVATANPFTHGVELVRYAVERQVTPVGLAVVAAVGVAAFAVAVVAIARRPAIWDRGERLAKA
jgi:ABC-2 type transport system permease protein